VRHIDAAEAGIAPKILAGWQTIQAVLADGEWHAHNDLIDAVEATGLSSRTAINILRDARTDPARVDHNGKTGAKRMYRTKEHA